MPFDPLSAGVAGAGMILDFIKGQQARKDAQQAQAFQQDQLIQALNAARAGQASSMRAAGGMRLDQFGNATYYDPNQGRWITSYSPTQQRLIDEGQARQERANIRGAQASQDYDQLRGEYLYNRPKSEAQSYDEIIRLLNQAQGTGERALNTLTSRWGTRTAGNLPTLVQSDNGPSPGQQLAETMLKARGAALDESLKREAGHGSRYLPALKQFEDTANYVAPVDPTGNIIQGYQQSGIQDILKTGTAYDQLLSQIALGGARNVGAAASLQQQADKAGPGASDFLNFAKMLMPTPEKDVKGTLGNTKGARYSGGGSDSDIGTWDRRFNFGPTTKGAGGEAAPFGGASPADYSLARMSDPFVGGYGGAPDYGDVSAKYFGAAGGNYLSPIYANPWTF